MFVITYGLLLHVLNFLLNYKFAFTASHSLILVIYALFSVAYVKATEPHIRFVSPPFQSLPMGW